MIRKLYHLLAILGIACTLGGGALVGTLVATGQLNAQRVDAIASILRGESPAAPASQPAASAPARVEPGPAAARAPSADEIARHQRETQLRRLALDRASADLRAQQELLGQAMHELIMRGEQFDQKRTDWLAQREKLMDESRDSGFAREVELLSNLAPKQAKEHLVRTWRKNKADAVRIMNALSTSKAKALLSQLKTPEETEVLHELMEQLRTQDVTALAPEAGTASDDDSSP